jgi:hypothetical protein
MTVEEALCHPYLTQFKDAKEEKSLNTPILTKINDNTKLSLE